jgi:hypothetical protein
VTPVEFTGDVVFTVWACVGLVMVGHLEAVKQVAWPGCQEWEAVWASFLSSTLIDFLLASFLSTLVSSAFSIHVTFRIAWEFPTVGGPCAVAWPMPDRYGNDVTFSVVGLYRGQAGMSTSRQSTPVPSQGKAPL